VTDNLLTDMSVYVLNRQVIDAVELSRFLEDHGVSWESDSDVGAEVSAEVGGRVCYMSFAKPRPGGNAAYLKHIKEVGHGSVTEHAVWTLVITGVSRSLSHELVRHRAGWSYCLTGDTLIYSEHKCNGKRDGARKRKLRDIYRMSLTPHGRSRIKLMRLRCLGEDGIFTTTRIKAVAKSGKKRVYEVRLADGKTIRGSEDHRFLTTDGWVRLGDLNIGQPLATNGLPAVGLQKEWLRKKYHDDGLMIEEIAVQAGCSPNTVSKWIGRYGLRKKMGVGMTGRRPWNEGVKYTAGWHHTQQTRDLLAAQKRGSNNPGWQGDDASPEAGRQRAQGMYPTQPCEACGDDEGHRHHIDRNTLNNRRKNITFLCASCHQLLHIKEDGPRRLGVRWVAVESVEYVGVEETYDIEVEDESHNFVANGFVTHNSQLSQRYVDESQVKFVVPPDFEDEVAAARQYMDRTKLDVETAAATYFGTTEERPSEPPRERIYAGLRWLRSVYRSREDYKVLADYQMMKVESALAKRYRLDPEYNSDDPDLRTSDLGLLAGQKTEKRKFARQSARSVLPNATETKIQVTVNARAARHFIEQRGSRHADPEIRRLAYLIWATLALEAPNLFSDYRDTLLPDGSYELTTPFPKV